MASVNTKTTTQLKGVIKTIKKAEGYGFITHTATGEDHFFHRSSLVRDEGDTIPWELLELDQRVEFTPVEGPKGLRAVEVRTV